MNASTLRKSARATVERNADPIRIGGLERLSLCDWPGRLAATVFCQGCPWDCPYCHNPHLLPARGREMLPWPGVLAFLETRRGLLDSVVFSGGEPTMQKGLPDAIRQVRAFGFGIGLHSAGPYPQRLATVLPLVDWVGFDVKAAFGEYDRVTRVPLSGKRAKESLRHLLESGVAFELRTTADPHLLDEAAVERLRADLADMGAPPHRLQSFRSVGTRYPTSEKSPGRS
ncbi:pyruvate formate lyase activating enzyme [Pseudochelatococcus lubricantis]|uniref:Pyruvate formate lyase activating enzyme n=1 Tax=Pseudochelatococcus lubricantis TaxID=1538102 RepID=A0ABX0V616_9HYPH|nr:anaerobic ribonucleoside-triphosphate reductase activating protein [Pseudochelatococcus lubricantis]NIJ59760.1 pyruvate formate lyase activating enzyme [Pseudochelatococcus lubricantis]